MKGHAFKKIEVCHLRALQKFVLRTNACSRDKERMETQGCWQTFEQCAVVIKLFFEKNR